MHKGVILLVPVETKIGMGPDDERPLGTVTFGSSTVEHYPRVYGGGEVNIPGDYNIVDGKVIGIEGGNPGEIWRKYRVVIK